MRLATPVYFAVGTALCLYLAMASRNGWSLVQSLTPRAFTPAGRNLQHK
mgnify:CR=1 FL=1